jgi:hypothetical protein
MKRLLAAMTAALMVLALAGTALAAPPPTAPGQNKLQCFADAPATCTQPTKGAKGSAILDTTLGGDAGVYVLNSNINLYAGQQTPLSAISMLSFTYTGIPTNGSPRISLPLDIGGGDTTDAWAYISAYWCNNGSGLVDAINNPNCQIFVSGNINAYVGWAAFVAAYPTATVPFDNYVFVIADDPGLWTVSNVKLGKPGK